MVRVLIATALSVLVSGFAVAQSSNEGEIRKRADEFTAAWNKHDPQAMASLWAPDGDLINPFGRKAKGTAEIRKLFQDEHSTAMKKSTYKVVTLSIRFVEPEMALLDADDEVTGVLNPDGTMATIKPHVVSLLKKSGGKWWIVATRAFNFTPAPAAPKK